MRSSIIVAVLLFIVGAAAQASSYELSSAPPVTQRFIITYSDLKPAKEGVTTQDCVSNYGQSYEFTDLHGQFTHGKITVTNYEHEIENRDGIELYWGQGVAKGVYQGKTQSSPIYVASVRMMTSNTATGVFHDGFCQGYYSFAALSKDMR